MPTIRAILARAVVTSILVAVTTTGVRADSDRDRIASLQAKFRCPIFEYLVAIHHTSTKLKDRFLIATIDTPAGYYTQCIFYSKDRKMHCEAESPFYHAELGSYFTPQRLSALHSLGYSTKATKNNFHLERKVTGVDSLYGIAGLYVDTLAHVFDMQIDERLTYQAPLVPLPPQASTETGKYCQPRISLR